MVIEPRVQGRHRSFRFDEQNAVLENAVVINVDSMKFEVYR